MATTNNVSSSRYNGDHVIPLSNPGPNRSQREYVLCLCMGIGFAAHRFSDTKEVYHYKFPRDMGCVSAIIDLGGPGQHTYIVHNNIRSDDLKWIEKCRKEIELYRF